MNVFCPTDVIFAEKAIEPSHDKANKYIMYSDKKNILQLVALLIEHNIKKIVLCPGSRNSPIVHTIANHPFFSCYPVTDERSAAFFAIGLALHGGSPAAVCCTSGSALLNIHPAVSEAFYQQTVPGPGSDKWTGKRFLNRVFSVRRLKNPSTCRRYIPMKTNGIAIVLSTKLCSN